MRKIGPKLSETYLAGLLGAYKSSNAELVRRKQPKLFCAPGNLAITGDNLKQLIADFLENRFKKDWANRTEFVATLGSLDLVALWALQGAFPCKE